jgi:hypothetical protein
MTARSIKLALAALLAFPLTALGGTVTGTVRNGTTGAPVGVQEVIVMKLQGGMEPLGTFKTDPQGRFRIEHDEIGKSPLLLRVVYRGVNYHQSLPPEQNLADIEIFEATESTKDLNVATRLIALQPNNERLLIGEEFTVHNHSKPPVTVIPREGNGSFEFWIPEGAELGQVSVTGASGLPLVQGTVDRGKGRYAINFPFRPGETSVRISFQVPYPQNAAMLRLGSPYTVQNVLAIAPPTVQVRGEGFVSRGREQDWNVFGRESVAANMVFELNVQGFAPPPAEEEGGTAASGAAKSATGAAVSVVPQRLDNLKWVLLAGLAALFALGGVLLWKRPFQQPAAAHAPEASSVAGGPETKPATASATRQSQAAETLKQIEQQAMGSLEAVKELLLRIEIRKQAGTISEEEYARERAQAEEMLRKFLG